jgi:hypothetical protein
MSPFRLAVDPVGGQATFRPDHCDFLSPGH